VATLFGRFRECAVRYPELTAIEVGGQTVRYRELLDLVERLAARLVEADGRPASAVGLLATRSLAGYAGYLAVLRLGATVVPLHPEAPVARNARICRSAGVQLIVVDDAGSSPALAAQAGAAALELRANATTPWYWSLNTPPWHEPYRSHPDEVAYVLFTSGSTGEPKGEPIRHRNLAEYLPFCVEQCAAGPGDRFAAVSELSVDASISGTIVALLSGATLVVPRPEEVLAPPEFVNARRITHWKSVPSLISIAHQQRTLPPGSMAGLRWSAFGGEQLTFEQANAWAAAAPHSIIENRYGPTELTVDCAGYRLPADQEHWPSSPNGTVPIGPVHPHLEKVVLTEDGLGTADGPAEGELCVRGSQRFDGYLDPTGSRGRFVLFDGNRAQDCDGAPSQAWYRTGDRVRVDAGGVMVHLGRLDHQVKIRGHRIELGEIESVLRRHGGILDAVVLAAPAEAGSGTPTLHAIYTGEPVDPAELDAMTAEQLPPVMRPASYRQVDQLPVNANGKVDRRRLAAQLSH
jgi:amino acid adenylation domain-containing protein